MTHSRTSSSLIALAVAAILCGCAASDERAGRLLVAPDQYVLYNCTELATAAQTNAVRQRELEASMAKAGSDSGGRLVSDLAYGPEYAQLRGRMNELRKAAVEKNCRTVPGVLGGRTSDQVVR